MRRNFRALYKAGMPRTDGIMQKYLANKTAGQQKVLEELAKARVGVDSFQKQSAERAARIDFLYDQLRPKAKAIAQMLPKLARLKITAPKKRLCD
jgi:hypothetical protein